MLSAMTAALRVSPMIPSPLSCCRLLPALAALAATLAACSRDAPQVAALPVEVTLTTVQRADLPVALRFPAHVAASRDVDVRARVSGIVVERAYAEGEPVAKGELLFRIEPDSYRAIHEQAVAEIERQRAAVYQTKNEYERASTLVKDGSLSRQDYDRAASAYGQARASLAWAEAAEKVAKLNLDYTEVRAPVSGVASKEAVTVGNVVSGESGAGGDLLTTIVQTDPAYVEFSIAEAEFLRLRALAEGYKGDYPVRVVAGSRCAPTGYVDFADVLVIRATGTVRARAVFPNADGCLLSGQYLSIEASGLSIPQVIAVPKKAVLFTQFGPVVWVVDRDGTASQRAVQIQESWEDRWLLEGGLEDGERIVVEGILKVRPGATVREVSAAPGGRPVGDSSGTKAPQGTN